MIEDISNNSDNLQTLFNYIAGKDNVSITDLSILATDGISAEKIRLTVGKDIEVNDGNTFIHICPTNAKVVIEAPVKEESNDLESE